MFKVGDRVRIVKLFGCDFPYRVCMGNILEVTRIYEKNNNLKASVMGERDILLHFSQIEKLEESKEMTFPEMVQNLIDGDFEVGTELIVKDQDGDTKTYEVIKNMYGFGLDIEKLIYPSVFNGKWTVKEQSIKEMSIEELQQELGYKIKIVE